MKVWLKPSTSSVLSVRNIVTRHWALACNLTYSGHFFCLYTVYFMQNLKVKFCKSLQKALFSQEGAFYTRKAILNQMKTGY
jgi:hypothetical protein